MTTHNVTNTPLEPTAHVPDVIFAILDRRLDQATARVYRVGTQSSPRRRSEENCREGHQVRARVAPELEEGRGEVDTKSQTLRLAEPSCDCMR